MCRSIIFPVYLFLAGCVGLFSKPGLNFDSNRVHLVDNMNGVYFFRGNEPLIGDEKKPKIRLCRITLYDESYT